MEKIRLLIVDDHKVVRAGIKLLFSSDKNIQIVGEAENGEEALERIEELKPTVILTDISMPKLNGIEFTRKMKELHPEVNVLILSMHDDDEYIIEALEVGAMGYLLKDSEDKDIISAVYSLGENKMYYSASVSNVFARKLLKDKEVKNEVKKLTERELEVMDLIVKGFSNKEIANQLSVSKRTIDNHRTNCMKKINAKNTADIVRTAITMGFVEVK